MGPAGGDGVGERWASMMSSKRLTCVEKKRRAVGPPGINAETRLTEQSASITMDRDIAMARCDMVYAGWVSLVASARPCGTVTVASACCGTPRPMLYSHPGDRRCMLNGFMCQAAHIFTCYSSTANTLGTRAMKASAIGLACFAGIANVCGFVSHVIPRGSRASHDVSSPVASHPPPRPHRPAVGMANSSLFMKKRGAHLGADGEGNRTRHLSSLMGNPGGLHKVALLALAGAVSCQLLPHAAVAATETAVPIASAAVDGTLVERLTSSGFFQAFSLVFVSEIGDKTFFIAALLAAKTSRLISFAGSVGALAVMTVLAVLLGLAFHSVPSVFTSGLPLDDIIAAAAFLYFGINTLKDAYALPDDSNQGIEEERAEAEESVKELEGKKTVW